MTDVIPLRFPDAPAQVLELLTLPPEQRAGLTVGTARLLKGERVPQEGNSQHAQHEVSLILKGDVELQTGSESRRVGPGEVVVIPAGQSHRSIALEDTEVLWLLFGPIDE